MPVDDHPTHERVIKRDFRAGCYNRGPAFDGYLAPDRVYWADGTYEPAQRYIENTASPDCRQVGRKVDGQWEDLPECQGCQAQRDWQYINASRERI